VLGAPSYDEKEREMTDWRFDALVVIVGAVIGGLIKLLS
jgi:hypothetical protein